MRLAELTEKIAIAKNEALSEESEAMLKALRANCGKHELSTSLYWGSVKSTVLRRSNPQLEKLIVALRKSPQSPERIRAEEVLRLAKVAYRDGENNLRTFYREPAKKK